MASSAAATVPDPERPGFHTDLEPLWTCESRWRAAWYRTRGLEARAVALLSLVEFVDDRKSSWQQLLTMRFNMQIGSQGELRRKEVTLTLKEEPIAAFLCEFPSHLWYIWAHRR